KGVAYAESLIQFSQNRNDGIGGAGGVGDNPFVALQLFMVNTQHSGEIHVLGTIAGIGYQHTRATGVQKLLQLGSTAKGTTAFDQHVQIQRRPVYGFRVDFMQHPDGLIPHNQLVFVVLYLGRKYAVGRIKARQIRHGGYGGGLVNDHDIKFLASWGFVNGAQQATAYAAIAINRDADGTR